ncbi:hypothetical protein N9104_01690 [Pseudomonadales bacterium]|nr:hypothetical protein [Pseudomonadales bacterium]
MGNVVMINGVNVADEMHDIVKQLLDGSVTGVVIAGRYKEGTAFSYHSGIDMQERTVLIQTLKDAYMMAMIEANKEEE